MSVVGADEQRFNCVAFSAQEATLKGGARKNDTLPTKEDVQVASVVIVHRGADIYTPRTPRDVPFPRSLHSRSISTGTMRYPVWKCTMGTEKRTTQKRPGRQVGALGLDSAAWSRSS